MNTAESLCRPDGIHWRVECCRDASCESFVELPDKSLGCLGHDLPEGQTKVILVAEGVKRIYPQSPVCRQYDCLAGVEVDREELKRRISQLPPGAFRMSEVR
jgi:hypothetical protein